MHPLRVFNIKDVLLPKHAQHVVLIHFPIALFIVGMAFDFMAQWTKRQALAMAAYCNLAVAALTTPVVIISGLLAWQLELEGQRLRGILLLHLSLGIVSGAMICMTWYLHFRSRRRPEGALPAYRLPIELLTALLVVATAHLGGFLSGVNIPSG
jgi:uncharacterized membrane protein